MLDILTSHYESSLETQLEMVESLAQIARTTIAQQKAEALSKTLGTSLDDQINQHVAKVESVLLMQMHKETLIREACSYITYMNHGTEEEACTELLANPNFDAGRLISYNYENNMCECSSCTQDDKAVLIPAAVNNGNGLLSVLSKLITDFYFLP